MAPKRILRIVLSSDSLAKTVSLIANGALLVSNAFMVASGLKEQAAGRRRQQIAARLQGAAEVASRLAALARVVSDTLEQHRGPGS
ncbi:MAG: hypothetical protein IIA60_10770 [Candidatus Marinimicrobia bacterium]|nr:hypothetical protein [Candidatus Neomarinimicrobiota bacterium]